MSKSTNTLNTPSNDASGSGTDKMTTLQVREVIISYKIILIVKEQIVFILKELNLGDR